MYENERLLEYASSFIRFYLFLVYADHGFVFSQKNLYIKHHYQPLLNHTDTLIPMSTKPPSSVIESPAESLEKLAYCIAAEIPAQEPNDNNRLGYCLWGWLSERRGSLFQAIHAAGVRTKLTNDEIFGIIQKRLEEKGIKVS